ncbi:MAG: hypothetical protein OHK0039_04460 [Bacteroidia bacterium]
MRTLPGFLLLLLPLLLAACHPALRPLTDAAEPRSVYRILPHDQPRGGDPQAGFAYLTTGGYVGSGFPLSMYPDYASYTDTVLRRDGLNAHMLYSDIAFEAPNGATVVSGSCFTCHASRFQGQVVLGLGDSFSDFTGYPRRLQWLMPWGIRRQAGKDSPDWAATETYTRRLAGSIPWIRTEQYGLNPAFRMEEAFAYQLDPQTLTYRKAGDWERLSYTLASDVPPLWHVRKKQALYYNGMGRGDFTKLLMQAGTMGLPDTATARAIQQRFVDVLAWLETLTPPPYTGSIDRPLAATGALLFEDHCQKCHGSYGPQGEYPNKLVPVWEVQTDPLYAQYFLEASGLPRWFNEGWFGQSPPFAEMKPSNGYMAPPLDGIWATAPYLHNGSVPTLADLLYSPQRPRYWQRSGRDDDYDWTRLGWRYTTPDRPRGDRVYDTTRPGSGNQGHYFGDELSDSERLALLEYLKTL